MNRTLPPARRRRSALVLATAMTAGTVGALSAVPASGLIPPTPGVRPGKSITVIHNIDMVAVSGYEPLGRQVTVRVVRNGVTVGSATGPSTFLPEGSGLEVNHGVENRAPVPGECWDGHTPDIRPGDHIVVTDGAGRDEVVVDDIRFTGGPSEAPDGDILVPFRAVDADNVAIPLARLDAAAFREDQIRYAPEDIIVEPAEGGAPGDYQMRYDAPFTPTRTVDDTPDPDEVPPTQADIERALRGDGHTIGFGPVVGGPGEGMLVEGRADVPGPAEGCEASAPIVDDGVTGATPGVINASTSPDTLLRVSGFSEDASEVQVELRDADSLVSAGAELSAASGLQTWRASFAATELEPLSGDVRVTAVVDGVASSITKSVLKDTTAPDAPTASLPAGTYRGPRLLTLGSGASDRVRYTLGDGTQAAPTATRGTLYRGGQIRISFSKTLKMVSVDGAGNLSRVVRLRYQILRPPSAPRIRRASAGDPGGRPTARAAWRAPLADNGAAVSGYRVSALRLRADNSVAARRVFRVDRPRARALVMRLAAGRYAFRVRAVNELGAGRMSARSNVVRSR